MMSNDFYLCGYYGMKNSGDDALLHSTLLGAKKYLQAEYFSVNTPTKLHVAGEGSFPARLKPYQSFTGENRLRQCISAFRSNRIIFGGGSVLHCERDINTKRLMMKLAGRGPHIAVGVGIGPFKNSATEKSCARFLNECTYIGVRDETSFSIAKSIAPKANVELTFDLAPILGCKLDHDLFDDYPRRGIGVALCPKESLLGDANAENYRLKRIATALADVYRKSGEPIFLIDMNGHKDWGDTAVHDQLHAYLPNDIPVFRLAYNSNPVRLMARLKRMKTVVAMRLHGSILSYMVDTPVISLNYHSKCNGWCKQIGLPLEYQFNADSIDECSLSAVLVNGLESGFKPCTLSVHKAMAASLKNFKTPLMYY